MRQLIVAFAFLFSFVALSTAPAHAELKIDITSGTAEPMPIAITDFYGAPGQEGTMGTQIAGVITANLERSGLFRPIPKSAFIQDAGSLRSGPRFADWRVISAQALVAGQVIRQNDGRYRVEFRLWDVFAENQMAGMAYFTVPQNWRRIAHIISDAIYKRLTGEEGYFDTRIVYIGESGPATNRMKRLAIMDQDGENHRFLTDGRTLVLTPRFNPSAQEITYMAYYNNRPRVYLFNIDTGRQELLGDFPNMTFAPRFSPDGNRVLFSLSDGGGSNSSIYVMDLRTRRTSQLTNHPSINTGPSFSPDGRQVVFESDRSGTQQLYTMDANGGNVQRISFGDGRYASPVWSPRGDLIAFTKMKSGRFYVGVMRTDGSGERSIVEAFHVEGPSWAPNGRVLTYFKETPSSNGRRAQLYTIDLTGFNERVLTTPLDGSDPAWSPLLP